MDDFKIWLYVIIGVIYVLARIRKKKPEEPKVENREFNRPPSTNESFPAPGKTKQPTFEELLREITEAKKPKPVAPAPVRVKPAPKPQPVVVDYDDEIGEEEQDLEDINYDYSKKDKSYAKYAESNRQPFYKPSLEETMKLTDTDMKFGKFAVFEEERSKNVLESYIKELQDPEGFKKAFIMSEILNRRF